MSFLTADGLRKVMNTQVMSWEKTVHIDGQEVLIRRLNGSQWDEFIDGRKKGDPAVVVLLQYGLLDGDTRQPMDKELVQAFFDNHWGLADQIAFEIQKFTLDCSKKERERAVFAEKNLPKTGSTESDDTGVTTTDKGQKPVTPTKTN